GRGGLLQPRVPAAAHNARGVEGQVHVTVAGAGAGDQPRPLRQDRHRRHGGGGLIRAHERQAGLAGGPRRRQRCPRDGLARGVPRAQRRRGGAPAELGRLLQGRDRRVPPPLRPLPPPPRPRPRHLHVQ
ncbi:hypothetical protein ZWY2020_039185, partial [Hordeum vulgare]